MNSPEELTILASCPFCGCAAAYYGAAVRCTSFKCNAGLSPDWTTKAVRSAQGDPDERLRQAQVETAERWNRRASQAAPARPTEAMLNAARDWSDAKYGKPIGNDAAIGCWNAMLVASPGPSDGLRQALQAVYDWQAGSHVMPTELWVQVRAALSASPAQEGSKEPEQVGTCEACSKAIIDGEKYASTTDGCSLCFECAPMLSDVVRQMDEALENGEAENWFDLSENELRADRENIAEDIATNGDRKAVH